MVDMNNFPSGEAHDGRASRSARANKPAKGPGSLSFAHHELKNPPDTLLFEFLVFGLASVRPNNQSLHFKGFFVLLAPTLDVDLRNNLTRLFCRVQPVASR